MAFPEPRMNPCTWRAQSSSHPLLFASSCSFLCLPLINPRQICTDSTPTHTGTGCFFPPLNLKITTLSLSLIKAQHFSSYREVKIWGFVFLDAFSGSRAAGGGEQREGSSPSAQPAATGRTKTHTPPEKLNIFAPPPVKYLVVNL